MDWIIKDFPHNYTIIDLLFYQYITNTDSWDVHIESNANMLVYNFYQRCVISVTNITIKP